MRDKFSVERLETLIKGTTSPIMDVKAAHNYKRQAYQPVVTVQLPPADVNAYDELIAQLEQAHPEKMKPYIDGLYDRVQTPDDIPAALGTLALILDQELFTD
jgi:hypothetical protein